MNRISSLFLLALGVLSLKLSNAQMCPGDHAKLSHHSEFNITVSCTPQDPDTYLSFDFGSNAGIYSGMFAGGWCIDVDRSIFCDEVFSVDSYSSYDNPNIPPGAIDLPENLDVANWLINNFPIGSSVDIPGCYSGALGWEEYQEAMWTIMDGPGRAEDLGAEDCIVAYLVEESLTRGQDFQVNCDTTDKVGVVLIIDDDTGYITHQVIMAELPIAELKQYGICDCAKDAYIAGDPHFKTWSGELYDYHGLCDLTLLTNPQFKNGMGMDIHVRAKQLKEWSYISTAVLRIGDETFEVAAKKDGDTFWLNGVKGPWNGAMRSDATIKGFSITYRRMNSFQRAYTIHISNEEQIEFQTWGDFVRVDVKGASSNSFHGSLGLMGAFDQKGAKLGRDGVTVFDDVNEFGMEWQVTSSEAMLFHEADGPQHPEKCVLPSATSLKRRLAESLISQEEAEIACSRVSGEARDLCVFDVMATNDKDVAGAY
jgi:hypothetical protein